MRSFCAISRDAWLTVVFCAVLGGFIFIATSRYPVPQAQGFGHGPAFYPRVLAGALIILGLLDFLRDLRTDRSSPAEAQENKGTAATSAYGQVGAFLAICAAAILAMNSLGFLISGWLLVFFSTLTIRSALRGRDTAVAAVYATGIMAMIYLIFSVFVGIQLPPATIFG
jgi:putative tricarboxylic transport membrane protein